MKCCDLLLNLQREKDMDVLAVWSIIWGIIKTISNTACLPRDHKFHLDEQVKFAIKNAGDTGQNKETFPLESQRKCL